LIEDADFFIGGAAFSSPVRAGRANGVGGAGGHLEDGRVPVRAFLELPGDRVVVFYKRRGIALSFVTDGTKKMMRSET
jgi:hypothetical protein